jgi:hypothetical protein
LLEETTQAISRETASGDKRCPMPPRLFTGAIIIFWLAMTGWLIEREVMPMMLADASPTYQVDLTDEIGSPLVRWKVWRVTHKKGEDIKEHIGDGDSKIQVNEDRSSEFRSTLRFKEDKLALLFVQIRRLENVYCITEDGKMLSSSAKAGVVLHGRGMPDQAVDVEMTGKITNNILEPQFKIFGQVHQLGKVELPRQGSIANPMQPVHRLRGLHQGQIWNIALIDPLQAIQEHVNGVAKQALQAARIPSLIAEVKTDTLWWNGKEVDCYKIEYYPPGQEVTARTWVRKKDDLVLQQEAKTVLYELILERLPN